MKDKKRGKRRDKSKAKIKKRLKNEQGLIFGADDKHKEQPNRLNKSKPSFTYGSSLKKYKRTANKKSRRKRHMAADKGEEPPPEGKNSVKWDYW